MADSAANKKDDATRGDPRPYWVDARNPSRDLDEEIFSAGFSGDVVRRFWGFVRPYRSVLIIGLVAVLLFALSTLTLPWIVRITVNNVINEDDRSGLFVMVGAFFGAILIHVVMSYLQNIIVGRVAEHLLIDLRRAMYSHLQRVSMSFMDKTEVGRMMSRLQGDVAASAGVLGNGGGQRRRFRAAFWHRDCDAHHGLAIGAFDLRSRIDAGDSPRNLVTDCPASIPLLSPNEFNRQWRTGRKHQRSSRCSRDEPRTREP